MAVVRRLVNLISYEEVPGQGAEDARDRARKFGFALAGAGLSAGIFAAGIAAGEAVIGGLAEVAFRAEQRVRALSKSQQAGAENAQTLRDAIAGLPFLATDLTKAFVRLQKIGLDPSMGMLRDLANIALGSGQVSMDELSNVIAKAADDSLEELEKLGVAAEKRGSQVRLSFRDTAVTVDQTSQGIVQGLRTIANEEQRFAGQVGAAMNRPLNRMVALVGRLVMAIADMGDTVRGPINDSVDVFERFVVWVEANRERLAEGLIPAFDWLSKFLRGTLDLFLGFQDELGGTREAVEALASTITLLAFGLLTFAITQFISFIVVATVNMYGLVASIAAANAGFGTMAAFGAFAALMLMGLIEEIVAIFDDDLNGVIEGLLFQSERLRHKLVGLLVVFGAIGTVAFAAFVAAGTGAALAVGVVLLLVTAAAALWRVWDDIKVLTTILFNDILSQINRIIDRVQEWIQWLGEALGLMDRANEQAPGPGGRQRGRIGAGQAARLARDGLTPMEMRQLQNRGVTAEAARTLRQNNTLNLEVPQPEEGEDPEEYGERLGDAINTHLQDLKDNAEQQERGGKR